MICVFIMQLFSNKFNSPLFMNRYLLSCFLWTTKQLIKKILRLRRRKTTVNIAAVGPVLSIPRRFRAILMWTTFRFSCVLKSFTHSWYLFNNTLIMFENLPFKNKNNEFKFKYFNKNCGNRKTAYMNQLN